MTLPLTSSILEAAYELIRATPPFDGWNLPDGDEIVFKVTRSNRHMGEYYFRNGKHHIAASSNIVGHTHTLIALIAHEAVHLHQKLACMETKGQHNAAFKKLAARVCKIHGFDPKVF